MGAIELGEWPCNYCYSGWGSISINEHTTCRTTCVYMDMYNRKMREETKSLVDSLMGKGIVK